MNEKFQSSSWGLLCVCNDSIINKQDINYSNTFSAVTCARTSIRSKTWTL